MAHPYGSARRMLAAALALAAFCGTAMAEEANGAQPNDYSDPETWLCRPDRNDDACAIDLAATVVHGDGSTTHEPFVPHPDPAIDCFYVYPTVSIDATPNSDMTAGAEELNVIRVQFARFASQCRAYAPLYRQITLTALRSAIAGQPMTADRELAYNDVVDAWNYYLEHENAGRGVVLVGHSQGAGVLTRLLRDAIEGTPVQSRVVSALLLGTNVAVPDGKDSGGALQMPLCRETGQTGCVVSYVTFRSTQPPPENTRFGRIGGMFGQQSTDGLVAACTNPARLEGGRGELQPYFAADAVERWTANGRIETPFVTLPGLLSAECVRDGDVSYLSVNVDADSDSPRVSDIPGDVRLPDGSVAADWGLHLVDVHVAMGDLLELVGAQARAWGR